jgi:16S rRNA processing protein RimM
MRPVGRSAQSVTQSHRSSRLVEIGRVVNRHGVGGEVRVLPYNPDSTLLLDLPSVLLAGPGSALAEHRVRTARRHKRFVLLRIDGIETASAAEGLIGQTVWVPREQLPQVESGEFYHADLIGCRVVAETGEEIGPVREVLATAGNDVCIVDGAGGEHLIPLIDDVVVRLDVEAREILIRVIPGLLDR